MKKILALLLALVMVFSLAACGGNGGEKKPEAKSLKVGFIFAHDENSTYDLDFMNAADKACKEMNVEIIKKVNVAESSACKDAALELVDEGCQISFCR